MTDDAAHPVRLELSVYRRDPQVREGPIAEQAHADRRRALEEVLRDPGLCVKNWGDTEAARPHELVSVAIETVTAPVGAADPRALIDTIVEPGAKFLAEELGKAVAGLAATGAVAGIVKLVRKLTRRAERREIFDFHVNVQSDATVEVYPSQHFSGPKIAIQSADRSRVEITYEKDFPADDEAATTDEPAVADSDAAEHESA